MASVREVYDKVRICIHCATVHKKSELSNSTWSIQYIQLCGKEKSVKKQNGFRIPDSSK